MCVCLGRGHSGVEALTPTVLVIGDGPWVRRGPLTMDFASVEEETGQGAHIFTTQQAPLLCCLFGPSFFPPCGVAPASHGARSLNPRTPGSNASALSRAGLPRRQFRASAHTWLLPCFAVLDNVPKASLQPYSHQPTRDSKSWVPVMTQWVKIPT